MIDLNADEAGTNGEVDRGAGEADEIDAAAINVDSKESFMANVLRMRRVLDLRYKLLNGWTIRRVWCRICHVDLAMPRYYIHLATGPGPADSEIVYKMLS